MTTTLRRLARAPLFTAGAILTLGLGLGAASAIFQVADAVYLRALPFPEPERLVRLFVTPPGRSSTISLRAEMLDAVRSSSSSLFDLVVGQRLTTRTLQGTDGAVQIETIGVTDGWAELLGLRPQLGRLFTREEIEAGESSDAVILSDASWRTQFGADPAIVGRKLLIDGAPKAVIGVLPRGFAYPYEADFWHPTRADQPSSSPWSFNAPARLRQGVGVEAANRALAASMSEIERSLPAPQRGMVAYAVPLKQILLDGKGESTRTAMVVVAILLALVGANLAALFHARWLAGRRELALRAALGGGRGRIARTLAGEGLLVVGAGLALGVALSRLARPLLEAQIPARLADVGAPIELSWRAGGLALAVALLLFLATALLPAWRASRVDPFRLLRGDGGAGGGRDVRRATRLFVALQVGLAVALGAASLALAFDLRSRSTLDLGYDASDIAIASVSLSGPAYADPAAKLRFVERATESFRALPGIQSAAAVHLHPSDRGAYIALLETPASVSDEDRLQAMNRLASPELAATLGLRLIEGRWLEASDRAASTPVAVISESVARRFFPDGNAVGGRLRNARAADAGTVEIVGVVADLHEFNNSNAAWYRPLAQAASDPSLALLNFTLRSAPGAAPPGERALRDAVARVDPTVALYDYAPAKELLAETLVAQRDAAGAAAFLALFGLILAALGLFVRIAEAVVRRRRELGVRLALGATHRRLTRELLAEAARLALAGLVPGALAAVAAQRLLSLQLDAPALAADWRPVAIALAATAISAMLAAWLAGRRAVGVDPARELRAE